MNSKKLLFIAVVSLTAFAGIGFHNPEENKTKSSPADTLIHYSDEKHLANIKQLTFGGDNAEAYFSFDNSMIVWQITNPAQGIACDRIYSAPLDQVSKPFTSGVNSGRATCAYFMPGNKQILYASTHHYSPDCPPVPDKKKIGKYVWALYPEFDIFVADLDGKIVKQLTETPGYDAEATVSPKGDKIVFTSTRNGDIDLYTMNIDGSNVKQITFDYGYDGGAFFSPDGSQIVFRASRPSTDEDLKEYKEMLAQNLVAPTKMELFVCNVDGSNLRQVTSLGGANWAPFFHPSGKKIIFASNHEYKRGFPFNLYIINLDGTGLEKITHDGTFDAFPMFSFDGKKLIFSSNRNNGGGHDTNLFIADWVE